MIRKNYSLSAELRKQEGKRQSKIQNRQKHQHRLEKLSNTDPIYLYNKLERAKTNTDNNHSTNVKYLEGLQSDWDFMLKHGLHKDKIESFLKDLHKQNQEKERLRTKLWGQKSVYFNPELNPLGKVPNGDNLSNSIKSPLENYILPLKPHLMKHYDPDPLIRLLGIQPPDEDPPKFYKKVYNTGRDHVKTLESDSSNKRFKP